MIRHLLPIFLLSVSVSWAAADGAVEIDTREDSLNGAIAQFSARATKEQLNGFGLGSWFIRDATAQAEIRAYLEKHYSKNLQAAMRSSGNMHNPKIYPLRKGFEEAVLTTSSVKKIAEELSKIGYQITGIETEKFYLVKPANTFFGFIYLNTVRVTPEPPQTPEKMPN